MYNIFIIYILRFFVHFIMYIYIIVYVSTYVCLLHNIHLPPCLSFGGPGPLHHLFIF